MSIMRSLVTGFVSPFVEQQQAKFASKSEMDLYNKKLDAQLTSNIALKEKELELTTADDQRKEDEAMAKRKDFLIALGFTPEYLDFKQLVEPTYCFCTRGSRYNWKNYTRNRTRWVWNVKRF